MRILTVRQPWALTDPNIIGAVALTRLFKGAGHPSTFKESPRGAIIGIVDLVGAHEDGCSRRGDEPCGGCCSRWAMHDLWHLKLENPRPLAEPIPFTGALGLRTLDDETTSALHAATRSSPSPAGSISRARTRHPSARCSSIRTCRRGALRMCRCGKTAG